MSAAPVPPRSPLVVYGSRAAWLRAWRRGEARWLALIYWDEADGYRRHVAERWVAADDITKIDGEDYSHIPVLHTPVSD
ncbi:MULTISPECIES: hypothetical protein [Streptosporangium]|uniref:Antibiotic biosynthesis monooxygenase n=1 Tax=Streptosporangium brasiliense TaxID=47480 RepID=A0ABT9RAX0_9ACTN|nr:hypothetical protein [Streptosporangium brasiliense]MDP9866403.1 hypothetical protein [Streptosporangium brasiliense]